MQKPYLFLTLSLLLSFCGSSSDEPTIGVTPNIAIRTTEFLEGDGDPKSVVIEFTLSESTEQIVDLLFNLEESSAFEGEDYQTSSGAVSFAAGETSKSVELVIIPDDDLEFDEKFQLVVSNISNAAMGNNKVDIVIVDDDAYVPTEDADGFITPLSYPSMELVWSDEFNGTELNLQDWNYEIGNGCPDLCGWGNSELQLYSEDNTEVKNGKLVITAENPMGKIYSSSRLTTKAKQEFKWGRIDIRAKLPFGQGIWPAIWMLGANIDNIPWPVSGEIDIMEMIGQQPGTVHGTAHFDRDGHQFSGTGWSLNAPEKYADKFHVFTILWQKGQIEWFVDYNKFFTIKAKEVGFNYPFNDPFFIIANIAVGGQWPGDPDETTLFPQTMEIDYIRVFQNLALE